MGKRKSSSKPQGPKKKEKLPTVFQCLFCNHEKSVGVTIDKKAGVGNLHCKVCGQVFQTPVNVLSAPVDVYADWHDACDAVAKETNNDRPIGGGGRMAMQRGGGAARAPAIAEADGEDGLGDDFIVNDEQDAEGEYDDE